MGIPLVGEYLLTVPNTVSINNKIMIYYFIAIVIP